MVTSPAAAQKPSSNRSAALIVVGVLVLIAIGAAVFFMANGKKSDQPSQAVSDANLAVMERAYAAKNPSICSEIKGGVLEQKVSGHPEAGSTAEVFGTRAMTEFQAKGRCYEVVGELSS